MPLKPPSAPSTLQHDAIACRIPHQGSMCLLDRVTAWDSSQISCEASSHRDDSNPLPELILLKKAGIELSTAIIMPSGFTTTPSEVRTV